MEESYQILARKYRPQTFAEVVGQESIVTTLKNSIRLEKLAHAYLFCGSRGTGKTTLARLFAKALMCPNLNDDFEPCNRCKSCEEIATSRSLDVIEIDGASHRGIDDIRQINETALFAPSTGSYKIYIIDEVHMLTKEAFNALLKTLEEPPEGVKFFFATTEPHKVLPTILSRSIRFDLIRISHDKIIEKLSSIARDLSRDVSLDALELIAQYSEGSLRDAESLLDQILCFDEGAITSGTVNQILGLLPRDLFFSLDEAVSKKDLSAPFTFVDQIYRSGKDLHFFLDGLIEHYRLLLHLKLWPQKEFPLRTLKESYEKSHPIYSQDQCISILDFLLKSSFDFQKTSLKRIHLEMILLEIVQSADKVSLPQLVERLTQLQNSVQNAASHPVHEMSSTSKKEEPAPLPQPIEPKKEKPEPVIQAAAIEEPNPPSQSIEQKKEELKPVFQAIEPKKEEVKSEPAPPVIKDRDHSVIEDPTPLQREIPTPQPSKTIAPVKKRETTEAPFSFDDSDGHPTSPPVQDVPVVEKVNIAPPAPKTVAAQPPVKSEPPAQEKTPVKEMPQPLKKAEEPIKKVTSPSKPQSHYDTLMRFAAVELEGIVKTKKM